MKSFWAEISRKSENEIFVYKLLQEENKMGNCCVNYSFGDRDFRQFLTKEEKIELLKEYKESLEKEAKGITERIKELQKD